MRSLTPTAYKTGNWAEYSTVRYLGVELEDALAEAIEI